MSTKSRLRSNRHIPVLISGGVVVVVCLVQLLPAIWPSFDVFQRLEWISFDIRARRAFNPTTPAAPGLGAVFIEDSSLQTVAQSYGFSWPWPRQLYGRLVEELTAQGAKVIGVDILFLDPHSAEGAAVNLGGHPIASDDYFARALRQASNVVLAAAVEGSGELSQLLVPLNLFRTNAWQLGHIASDVDSDAVLRRVKAFYDDRRHGRVWHMGVVLAARALGLDLSRAIVETDRIILPGPDGTRRVIPTDAEGFFYIDWSLPYGDRRIKHASFDALLQQELARSNGSANLAQDWKDQIVVIGSIGTGNNVRDVGATPLTERTFLVSKHWNVANSIIMDRFIRRGGVLTESLLIALLSGLSAVLTWRFRALLASFLVVAVLVEYFALGAFLYDRYRYWLPLVLPGLGALVMTHVCLVTYRAMVEQRERHRVKSIFSKVVAPDVVNELLRAEKVALGGARRKVTVFFADVRGFTRVTDEIQARADEHVRTLQLPPAQAEAYLDEQAREILATVNLYLGVIADTVKQHNGTLDKYIGDCVMAFWGAPAPSPSQAVDCVRAAMDAQRAIYRLNLQRAAENKRREKENESRRRDGQPPVPFLTLLALGTGINTGMATVGLMGSDAHIVNYTVFGREVNLASRLEGVSGRGRIIISESTFEELRSNAPDLASVCLALPPQPVKGFREPVNVYEVGWREAKTGDRTIHTGILTGREATLPTEFLSAEEL